MHFICAKESFVSCFAALSCAHVFRHKPRLSCFLCQLNVSLVRGMWGLCKILVEMGKGKEDWEMGHSPARSAAVPRAGSQVRHLVWGNRCSGKWENLKLPCRHWCIQSFQTTNTSEPCSGSAYPWISVSVHTLLVASTQGGTFQPWMLRNEDAAYWFSFSIYPVLPSQSCDL